MLATLNYIHDPMCSWCWAFRPVWLQMQARLKEQCNIRYVLGGLAPDTSDAMPQAMQVQIQQIWRHIQSRVPGTEFNFDFWTQNTPRRSTYPACRAVIAARKQRPQAEQAMILAIQQAYYLHAVNPSDDKNLTKLAGELGLDPEIFLSDLNAQETHQALMDDMILHQQLGARGFPSLILESDQKKHLIDIHYTNAEAMVREILSQSS